MSENLYTISALLLKQFLFHGLDVDQVKAIASKFTLYEYQKGQVVVVEGTPGGSFYIVFEGKCSASKSGKQYKEFYELQQGEVFGEEAAIFGGSQPVTIRAIESQTKVLRMEKEGFQQMLKDHSIIKDRITRMAESRELARKRDFPWFEKNEPVQIIRRRHEFFLARSLLLPFFMGMLAIFPIAFAISFPNNNPFPDWVLFIGILLLVLALVWGIWRWLDWENDYYIVTNRRVVWSEKVIGLYDSRNEAPLQSILSVDVSSSQLGRWLKYGNVIARTYTGAIPMRNTSRPYLLASFIEGNKKHVITLSQEQQVRHIRQDLNEAFVEGLQPDQPDLEDLVVKEQDPKAKQKEQKKSTLRDWLSTFLRVRYERDGVITYRKHIFVLLQKAWGALISTLLLSLGLGLLSFFGVAITIALCISPFLYVGILLWFAYVYVDWSNDIYRITPDKIFDIERKPLGTETKKSAPIENILSVEHEREGFLGYLLNFGTVIINVGETEFSFNGVYNPDQVHQDISDYQEAFRRKKLEDEEKREHKRMITWLMTYYDETGRRKVPVPPAPKDEYSDDNLTEGDPFSV